LTLVNGKVAGEALAKEMAPPSNPKSAGNSREIPCIVSRIAVVGVQCRQIDRLF
jgi:hypothetical protein